LRKCAKGLDAKMPGGPQTVRLYRQYHTLDIDEITALCRKEEET